MKTTLEKLAEIIVEQCGIEASAVKPEATFAELGVDSLDAVELVMAVEEWTDMEFKDRDLDRIKTVQEAVELIDKLGGFVR